MKQKTVVAFRIIRLLCVSTLIFLTCTQLDFTTDEGSELHAPVITLLGPKPNYLLNIGDTYTEPGAKATDSEDGDLTSSIEIDNSSVKTDAEGEYTVTYSVEDSDGNLSTKTRKVIVSDGTGTDKEKPVIQLNGDNPYKLAVGEIYEDPGATATDNVDGNITYKIQKYDTLFNTAVADSHTVYYVVSDNAGNVAMNTREVYVTGDDTTAPVITLKGPNPVNIEIGYSYTEYGATALDNVDGDLTDSIAIDNSSVDTSKVGNYSVYYRVSDAAGNSAEEIREVKVLSNVTDTVAPVITLKGSNPMTVYVDSPYVEPGATAVDDVEGDVSSKIVIDSSEVNTSQEGSFEVTYSVSDVSGNSSSKKRTVNVVPENFVDTVPPVIKLNGPNPVNLEIGYPYTEHGATATDNVDGDLTSKIEIDSSELNVNAGGSYKIYYRVSDAAGNDAEETRGVNVSPDTVPPVITLKGDNPLSIKIYNSFTDPGATAQDNIDGNISSKIKMSGTVDTAKAGEYTRTYTVADEAGNADTATRKVLVVEVIDSVKPVLTLLGDNPMTIEVGDDYVEPGATAVDDVDGVITSKIEIEGEVDESTVGEYILTYSVSDNAGNKATKTRKVNVVEQIVPDWEINVYYNVGDLVTYNGKIWKCIAAHTSQAQWYPGASGVYLWEEQILK